MGIDTNLLVETFTSSSPLIGRNEFTRNYTLDAALDARDACSKYIYAKLFTWIISKINQTLHYDAITEGDKKTKIIGLRFL